MNTSARSFKRIKYTLLPPNQCADADGSEDSSEEEALGNDDPIAAAEPANADSSDLSFEEEGLGNDDPIAAAQYVYQEAAGDAYVPSDAEESTDSDLEVVPDSEEEANQPKSNRGRQGKAKTSTRDKDQISINRKVITRSTRDKNSVSENDKRAEEGRNKGVLLDPSYFDDVYAQKLGKAMSLKGPFPDTSMKTQLHVQGYATAVAHLAVKAKDRQSKALEALVLKIDSATTVKHNDAAQSHSDAFAANNLWARQLQLQEADLKLRQQELDLKREELLLRKRD
ncbi:hypothetical protein JAAARDRAFT_199840 [Jaapia argillacea MUCL 33604]|uniref:Uncharacterized protein n=1 Tax=Jaapia argillacea MUCL 33604 TaxID=933084 RepID=A0A067PHT8_9AGAM|nr:hypothetical protein JAAARDRAFT_199840 [Jaapia argillacea MUCL 33604]